jgi:hypothetical protein
VDDQPVEDRTVRPIRSDSTVLISEDADPVLEDCLSKCRAPVRRYETMEELLGSEALDGVDVLILRTRSQPRGVLLAWLAKIALDHPGMQKVVLMEGVPSLPLAKHLTACGFRIIHDDGGKESRSLPGLVDQMTDRSGWMARVTA